MSTGGAGELERVRQEYESSLSWRVTRPLRSLRRRSRPAEATSPSGAPPARYDSWLSLLDHDGRLSRIDAACRDAEPAHLDAFRELDVDLWALLLTKEYRAFPHIRAMLPDVPDASLQKVWNGTSGAVLAAQTTAFYAKLVERYRRHGSRPLPDAHVLDFGCGWGRVTRYLARDVQRGRLFACDPVPQMLDVCRDTRVPAVIARSEFVPERLPFEQRMDLAFSFSVFTHMSERAHESCLRALHAGLAPGGILVVTVRPPDYLQLCELMHPLLLALDDDATNNLAESCYLFAPHETGIINPEGGEATYGEAVISLAYVRERWSPLFELLDVDVLIGDLHQVMLTLRRR